MLNLDSISSLPYDEKTSKKNETNTSKSADEDEEDDDKKENKDKDEEDDDKKENKDKDEEDDDKDGLVKYSGTLDMTSLMGTDELKDTVWTISVEGNDNFHSFVIYPINFCSYIFF